MQFKENYFGYYQAFTTMQSTNEKAPPRSDKADQQAEAAGINPAATEMFDPRKYRPLSVRLAITLHDIHGHLVKVN